MSTSFKLILLAFTCIFCFSCLTDFDLGIENNQQKIVVQSFLNPDSLVKVNVTGSISFLSDENIQVLEEAEVLLYENNSIVGQLKLHNEKNEFNYFSLDYFKPKAGNEYKVEVSYNNNQVTGKTHVPANTQIQSLKLDTTQVVVRGEREYYQCTLIFQDDDLIKNYYQVVLFKQSYNESRVLYLEGPDTLRDTTIINRSFGPINIEALNPQINKDQFAIGLLLTDEGFNGNLYTFEFLVPVFQIKKRGFFDIEEIDLYFILRTITREMYEFERTANLQGWVIDNPFAEPLPVTGNIENGLGAFVGYNQDFVKMENK